MVAASQLRAGMAIQYQGQNYRVVAAEYHPGQGKMSGAAHVRLQNLDTGTFWEHSLRGELKLEEIPLEKRNLEFLYADGEQCCFMDPDTFEQFEIAGATVGAQASFLDAGMRLPVEFMEGRPIRVVFPEMVEVRIAETAPPMHQQADAALKPAKLENGAGVMVPQFVKTGDVIRLDLTTMKYMDRVRAK
ncbi:MAG TPA: elongation factor P [Candidatus Sulfopaludibacter sp.]|nr:elongation factor P [Candidatus Sulfopaludibacter sp.]